MKPYEKSPASTGESLGKSNTDNIPRAMTRVKPRRFAIGEDTQEQDYLRIEREGIQDEGYWAAVNGTEFETEVYEHE
ncbi:MAG: hypothetical protein EOM58_11780 [Clostridia bacterium]|nr:hypothetical protein [Clostridia bacterium]